VIFDTGVLVAAANRRDRHHESATKLIATPGLRVIPEPVVTETCYMVASRLGSDVELAFVRSLLSRTFHVEQMTRQDRARAIELLQTYADAAIGYVDAAVVAIAERLGEHVIATLDRRDFSVVRPGHVDAFRIVPEG